MKIEKFVWGGGGGATAKGWVEWGNIPQPLSRKKYFCTRINFSFNRIHILQSKMHFSLHDQMSSYTYNLARFW